MEESYMVIPDMLTITWSSVLAISKEAIHWD